MTDMKTESPTSVKSEPADADVVDLTAVKGDHIDLTTPPGSPQRLGPPHPTPGDGHGVKQETEDGEDLQENFGHMSISESPQVTYFPSLPTSVSKSP